MLKQFMYSFGVLGLAASAAVGITAPSQAAWIQWNENGHCYEARLRGGRIDWQTAQNECMADGGHLATVSSAAENDFLFGLVNGNPGFSTRGPWLGGLQPAGSPEPAGHWQWITGESFVYSSWEIGEPNNGNGGPEEDGIAFFTIGGVRRTWNDVPRSMPLDGYIVELDDCTVATDESTWGKIKTLYR